MNRIVTAVNKFERKWKIRTNSTKFKAIPLSQRIPAPLIVENELLDWNSSGKLLELEIGRFGYWKHINAKIQQANNTLSKLRRFSELPTKIKLHLVKTLVLPVIDYPSVPLHNIAWTNNIKPKAIQNKALRFAINDWYPYRKTNEEIHNEYQIKAYNVRSHLSAGKIWQNLEALNVDIIVNLKNADRETRNDNRNFPSSLKKMEGRCPALMYRA